MVRTNEPEVLRTVGELAAYLATIDPRMALDCGEGYLPVIALNGTAPGEEETLILYDECSRLELE